MDESSGTVAQDQRGVNPGRYRNSPTLAQTGALAGDPDTAVRLNGTSQYITVPYSLNLNPHTFSVEAWVYPTGGNGSYRGVMTSRYYPQGWVVYAGSGNQWEFWLNNGKGMLELAGGTVTLNQWAYVVGTFDGATAKLYVNGVLVKSGTVRSYTPQSGYAEAIGQSEPGSNFWFPGVVDEPAVYGGALSATQIQNHYSIATTGH